MNTLGGEDVTADQLAKRLQGSGRGPDMIGQGRHIEANALAGVAFALPIERLVLAILGIKDHRQQARPDMPARDDMKRGWWLGDLLARAASEFFADGLDHLPLPGHDLESFSDRLAELDEPAAAAWAGHRRRDHHALARQ